MPGINKDRRQEIRDIHVQAALMESRIAGIVTTKGVPLIFRFCACAIFRRHHTCLLIFKRHVYSYPRRKRKASRHLCIKDDDTNVSICQGYFIIIYIYEI